MSTVIVPLDGLIRTDQGRPFQNGHLLYKTLVVNYRVVVASPMDVADTEDLLRRNALLGWAAVQEGSVLEVLRKERANGGHIHFCMTPDADEASEIFKQGISVLTIHASDFVNPKWRPERKSWSEIGSGYDW